MMASIAAPTNDQPRKATPRGLRHFGGLLVLLPAPIGWLIFFYLIPLVVLLIHAFWSVDYLTVQRSFTLENFRTLLTNDLYPRVLVRTVAIAALVTIADLILAFPVAFFLAKRVKKHRELLLLLVVFPLWSSYLVRVFAWKTILGTNGILNSFLLNIGLIDQPASAFLYSKTAMFLTFCQVWLPFMILPLFTVLDRMPDALLEAASDLGSSWWQTLRRVVFPLALPGILAGSLSVFSLTLGDFITPTLLGGPGDQMIGRLVADNFGMSNNWPLGATLIIPILLLISVFIAVSNRVGALGRTG
ncbi:MAG TPA: ABC transporter permease [Thermomicrobiales bacterium]|jgi:spermidine/putrescine transport system permease protein|nr:ABC transporter permease [Thermomicrobiales bacterium]